MTDKLDAATIRDLLAQAEKKHDWGFYNKAWLPSLEFAATFNPHQCAALARYALELSDKVESQAAELERVRGPEFEKRAEYVRLNAANNAVANFRNRAQRLVREKADEYGKRRGGTPFEQGLAYAAAELLQELEQL